MDPSQLKSSLLHPSAYTKFLGDSPEHTATEVQLIETHISAVFLVDSHVFKLKKPVDFGFLDFTTLEKRQAACNAELTLNRRLATDVYLGIVPVTRATDGGAELAGDGEVLDWAVHMNRLPDERRADLMLQRGEFGRAEVDRLAHRLVSFHASIAEPTSEASADAQKFGSPEVVARNVEENFEQTRDAIGEFLTLEQSNELARFQREFLQTHREVLVKRMETGRVRDGHGDLRLEHVYFLAGDALESIAIIDCIEFNRRFRYADVCADVAFLSMDLAEHEHVDLAERLLARYALLSDDFDLYELVDFYQSYRAYVRAKVAGFQALAPDLDPALTEQSRALARRHYLLALSAARRQLERPSVIAVAGLIASGKSSLADELGGQLAAPVVEADRIRKWLAGVSHETPLGDQAFSDAYSAQATRAVYAELLRRAGVVLSSGRSVVIDASFRAREDRRAARELARTHGAKFCLIECRCPREVTLQRLHQRAQAPSISDGRVDIFDAFAKSFEPIEELEPGEHIVIETTGSVADSVRALLASLP